MATTVIETDDAKLSALADAGCSHAQMKLSGSPCHSTMQAKHDSTARQMEHKLCVHLLGQPITFATARRVISLRPRVMRAARAFEPNSSPSAMPHAMAHTFLRAPLASEQQHACFVRIVLQLSHLHNAAPHVMLTASCKQLVEFSTTRNRQVHCSHPASTPTMSVVR